MKLAKHIFVVLTGFLFTQHLAAQQNNTANASLITITGVVRDSASRQFLPGVTISEGNGKALSLTKTDGSYSVSVPKGSVLYFSAVSYSTRSFTVESGETGKIVNLRNEAVELENVTITTALGISRQQKALGYSVQKLDSTDLVDARSNNWASALSGKVAGLNLLSSGSGPINSTRITLRGNGSMNPDGNNALIVIDGVPMNSQGTTSGVANAYGAGSGNDVPIDFGNGIADINPDDIESITVLKGPGATALYGSRAANGALLITTKSGSKKDKGIGVTVNSNTSVNTVLKWPDYQYEYGQGTGKALNAAGELYYSYGASADGASTSGTSSGFGPRFKGQMYYQYDPARQGQGTERTLWKPYENNVKGFWREGYTITNSISLEGGNDKGSARASLTHLKNEWIMPNTGYERITAAISMNYKISGKLKLNAKINYTNKQSDNLPGTGYNNQSIAYFMIFQNPNVDLNWYRDKWKKGLEQVDQIHPFSSFIDNPFLIAYEMTNAITSNNIVGNLSATYEISKKFDLMVRSGIAMTNEDRLQNRPYSTANYLKGFYKEQNITDYEVNTDGLLSYHEKLSNDINISAAVGANTMTHKYNRIDAYVDGLVIPGEYKLSNGSGLAIHTTTDRNKLVNSVYGLASFSFRNSYFLDITGRNDWSSTLPVQNNSFFYPSVNTSFILSDIFHFPAVISFAKFRLSAAQVGNDTEPYRTTKYYGTSEFASSASVPTTLPNASFKPEISTSYEAGLDLRVLKNRIGIDLTVYNNTTRNQILEVPLDPTTGYTRAILNSGVVRNRGIEVIIQAQPLKNSSFKWNTTLTWAKNENKVLELAEGMDNKQDIGYGGNATLQARVGGTTGDIYGFGFIRSPEGRIIYTKDGLPARPPDIKYIGSAYADWKGGLQNEFTFRNWRCSFLVDGQYGGIIYSQTHHKMTEQGKLKHTLRGREENYIIGDGVVEDGTGHYVTNTKKVLPVDYYVEYWRRANVESNSFDASFLKLREARIEYSLPPKWLGSSFIRQVTCALYGRDLLMLTSFPIFDPETAALNGSTLLPGVEMGQLPSTRTMGLNITVKF
ncbi:MAG: SusC/RagA family TonB-linked outer membrane protein [Chitinophagaceae bacterium]